MPSTQFTTIPSSMRFTLQAARVLNSIPDSVTDDDIISQSMIDPAMLALILQIVQEVIKCMNNNQRQAFGRIKNFLGARPFDRMADNMRLNSMVNTWADRLGLPRQQGDVVMIREAMIHAAQGLDEVAFVGIQTELIWLTI